MKISKAAAILLITLIVYIPAIGAGFIWDDDTYLTRNPLIEAGDGLHRFWFTTEATDYFPLMSSSLWLEWRLWGMNAMGYHVTNILLHALSSVFIWLILRKLRIRGAWLAGLVFAVHPVNVASVAWIAERKNTLSMLFYTLTVLCYLKSTGTNRKYWYGLSVFCFLLALLSKTSVVMAPFVLLICEWWRRGRITRRALLRTAPFAALSLALGLVTVWFQYNRAIAGEVVRPEGPLSRLAGAGWAVWFYLSKAILPIRLSMVYPRWEINASSIVAFLPLFLVLGGIAVLWRYRRTWGRAPFAGFAYYVVTLVPVLGIADIHFMRYSLVADHWQYISIIGVIALVTAGAARMNSVLRGERQYLIFAGGIAVIVLLCALSWRRAAVYRNQETLWRDTLAKNPSSWVSHVNLGNALIKKGGTHEATGHFVAALQINPQQAELRANLGWLLLQQGRLDEAEANLTEALRLNPDLPEVHNNLGTVFYKLGETDKAVLHYREALQLAPDLAMAHINLGLALASQGRVGEGIAQYNEALRLEPNSAAAHFNLGTALLQSGDRESALRQYQILKGLDHSLATRLLNLCTLHEEQDQGMREPIDSGR